MLALKLDGLLIGVQQRVQLNPKPDGKHFWVSGLQGASDLVMKTSVQSISRWLPKVREQQDVQPAGIVPGLLVVNLSTGVSLQLCIKQEHQVLVDTVESPQPAPGMHFLDSNQAQQQRPVQGCVRDGECVAGAKIHDAEQQMASIKARLRSSNTAAALPRPSKAASGPGGFAVEQQYEPVDILSSAVGRVVPTWDGSGARLQLALPQQVADRCTGVRLEVGGSLLPAVCTAALRIKHAHQGGPCYDMIGLQYVKPIFQGAQLMPCKAIPSGSATGTVGGRQGKDLRPWQLVLCASWPLAQSGHKVGALVVQYIRQA
jgi:hypothetical protein